MKRLENGKQLRESSFSMRSPMKLYMILRQIFIPGVSESPGEGGMGYMEA